MRVVDRLRRLPVRCAIFLIELYRTYVSPMRLPTCRFMPTCSQYAVEALTEFGLLRGSWLIAMRLAKCGPWHSGGWDPIPERGSAVSPPTQAGPMERLNADDDFRDVPVSRGESKSVV